MVKHHQIALIRYHKAISLAVVVDEFDIEKAGSGYVNDGSDLAAHKALSGHVDGQGYYVERFHGNAVSAEAPSYQNIRSAVILSFPDL